MKFADLLDAISADALDAPWLYERLEPVGEPGRRCAQSLQPFRPGQEEAAQQRSALIVRLAALIAAEHLHALRDALRASPDPLPALSRAAMGEVLADAHLLELLRFLDAAVQIDALMERSGAPMRYMDDAVRSLAHALEPGRAGTFGFYLSEHFDAALAPARRAAEDAQAVYDAAHGRLAQRVAAALGRAEIEGSEFIVMRDDVPVLPQGIRIVREAPTYYLCELDLDDSALGALGRRDEAANEAALAEERVRERISQQVRESAHALGRLIDELGALDLLLAQVGFAQSYACVVPEIVVQQRLCFEEARFLPLQERLEAQGRRYEPVSIDLHEVAVLTGPNMGGKSVTLRTCGFVAMLVAFGIPVPARSVRASLFEEISWLGIGVQEERGGLLSSFASEVVRLKGLLARPQIRMLLLIDEFARTTTPAEGKALLVALVRGLQRRGRLGLIATHLAGIARAAGVRHFAVRGLREVPKTVPDGDLESALAALAQAMDYSVYEVGEGDDARGDAIALAQLLGLDEDIIADAKEQAWSR